MSQPVIDTLQVADALRRTGMEQEQAEGLARTLGAELGEHVAVRGELHAGFDGIRAQMDALAGQFRFGLGLVVALFAAVVGVIGVLHANAPALQPASQPMPRAMPQPAPQPIALYLPPGASVTIPDVGMAPRPAVATPGAAADP